MLQAFRQFFPLLELGVSHAGKNIDAGKLLEWKQAFHSSTCPIIGIITQ